MSLTGAYVPGAGFSGVCGTTAWLLRSGVQSNVPSSSSSHRYVASSYRSTQTRCCTPSMFAHEQTTGQRSRR